MIRWLWLLLALVLPARAPAQESIVAGLSQNEISITTTFTGTQILVFGAIKRDTPPPPGLLGVIVTIEGPTQELTVRRKARRFGIWMNSESVDIDAAPSFYAVATSAPWHEIITDTEDLRWRVSIPRAIRSIGNKVEDSAAFTEALIRLRTASGMYQMLPSTVTLRQQTLFSTAVTLPAQLIEGSYRVRILLTRDGKVIAREVSTIGVQKAGLERWLFHLSQEAPLAYGMLAIALAIAAGWGASAAFRYALR
jgi:uncharacterized protein (TIGR02186 family)